MEDKIFFEQYRIRTNADESSREVSRTGAAINHEANDIGSNKPVVLQLVPLASIDPATLEQFKERARSVQKLDHVNIAKLFAVGVEDEYIALVSEYVEGETADSWIVAHGPMTADAVLRIGIQVVRALAAAAFFSLTHRAIQPSNIMIVPGRMDDDGWPFVKLLNFGLAVLESHSDSAEGRELAPSVAPQFASPEQLQSRALDFRSEIYSLGATMCFLLTGAVPLALAGKKARFRTRRLPELRRAPKALRNLLGYMLRENPEERPQDPVLFEQEIRKCLAKVERRQALRRKLGMPIAAVIPRATTASPVVTSTSPAANQPAPATANQPATNASPAPGASDASSPAQIASMPLESKPESPANQPVANSSSAPIASNASSPAQIASATHESQPEPPGEALEESSASQGKPAGKQDSETSDSASTSHDKAKTITSNSKRTSRSQRAREADSSPNEYARSAPRRGRSGSVHARFLGTTADGRRILRLPSGHIVVVTPGAPDEEVDGPSRHRATGRPEIFVPRPPPVYPPGYPPYD